MSPALSLGVFFANKQIFVVKVLVTQFLDFNRRDSKPNPAPFLLGSIDDLLVALETLVAVTFFLILSHPSLHDDYL